MCDCQYLFSALEWPGLLTHPSDQDNGGSCAVLTLGKEPQTSTAPTPRTQVPTYLCTICLVICLILKKKVLTFFYLSKYIYILYKSQSVFYRYMNTYTHQLSIFFKSFLLLLVWLSHSGRYWWWEKTEKTHYQLGSSKGGLFHPRLPRSCTTSLGMDGAFKEPACIYCTGVTPWESKRYLKRKECSPWEEL